MEFFKKKFDNNFFDLYPIGDLHFGSRQCNEKFVRQVVNEVKDNEHAAWVGMGDLMENAIIGSKSDVYMQTLPPKEQMEYIVELLYPIKDKGLFIIPGNHESRTHRLVGLIPEQYIAYQLDIPFKGYSCFANLQVASKNPNTFMCYFHHGSGGGYTKGGKVNAAGKLRLIAPTADAIFSGHTHTTSRMPVTWYDSGRRKVIKHVGYDYIIGSALEYDGSYAEEKAKPSATVEFIRVRFMGGSTGKYDNRKQIYSVITPEVT